MPTHTKTCTASRAPCAESTPGAPRNPLIKVRDLAWLEFEKPDLVRAEAFARAFGFTHSAAHRRRALSSRNRRRLAVRDHPPRTAVAVRRPRVRRPGHSPTSSGSPARPGRTASTLPEALGGVAVELTDPSGIPVRVVAGMHELAELPAQQPHTFNFGHELRRTNATQRPPREPARVQRLGHVVLQSTKYMRVARLVPRPLRDDRQRLPVLPGAARPRPGDELHPLRPRVDPRRPPHAGAGAGPVEPLCALRLSGMRPRRDSGRR